MCSRFQPSYSIRRALSSVCHSVRHLSLLTVFSRQFVWCGHRGDDHAARSEPDVPPRHRQPRPLRGKLRSRYAPCFDCTQLLTLTSSNYCPTGIVCSFHSSLHLHSLQFVRRGHRHDDHAARSEPDVPPRHRRPRPLRSRGVGDEVGHANRVRHGQGALKLCGLLFLQKLLHFIPRVVSLALFALHVLVYTTRFCLVTVRGLLFNQPWEMKCDI